MNWIIIVWSMNAASCLTLAGIYMLVWCKQREGWAYLVLSCSAVAGAALTMFELALLRAQTSEQYGVILRWAQLPVWVLVVSLVVFVRLYLFGGRPWLAWSVCGARTLALILNFSFIPNLSYREITSLKQVMWWGGETVSVPVGVTNPWILVAQLSLLLLVIFFVDATITAWRRGDRQRALVVGGALIFFSAIAVGQVVLVVWGIIQAPFLACFSYLGLITAMGYQMSNEMLHRTHLVRQLQASDADMREMQERMQLAADAAHLRMWEWDIVQDEIWATGESRMRLSAAKSDRLDFNRVLQSLHPDDRDAVTQAVARSMNGDGDFESEHRFVLPDGQTRWVAAHGRVEFNDEHKPIRMRGVSMDITVRKQAEEQFRLTVEASPNGIVLADQEGRIVLVNAQTEKLFGYAREELIGQMIEVLVPERFRGAHPTYRAEFMAAPQARAMGAGRELFARRKDGTEFPVEIGLNPIQTSDGILVLAAVVNISARKLAEEEARRRREEISRLTRLGLLGEMSASIAHELNQPLSGIVSNASAGQRFIDRGDADLHKLREIVVDIAADGRRAAEVIRNIRNTVKRGATSRQRLNLNDVVMNVAHMVHPDALAHSCQLKTSLAKDLPTIEVDPVQIQQVLINLVGNAFDAMRDTPVSSRKVEVATERNDDGMIRVSVRDHGAGIPDEARERLFDQFFSTKEQGLGMGLAIVRSIIEAHGGAIAAENAEGGGARFCFTLPTSEGNLK